jgi:hypothetical protein
MMLDLGMVTVWGMRREGERARVGSGGNFEFRCLAPFLPLAPRFCLARGYGFSVGGVGTLVTWYRVREGKSSKSWACNRVGSLRSIGAKRIQLILNFELQLMADNFVVLGNNSMLFNGIISLSLEIINEVLITIINQAIAIHIMCVCMKFIDNCKNI